jgi:hypothetical protein
MGKDFDSHYVCVNHITRSCQQFHCRSIILWYAYTRENDLRTLAPVIMRSLHDVRCWSYLSVCFNSRTLGWIFMTFGMDIPPLEATRNLHLLVAYVH